MAKNLLVNGEVLLYGDVGDPWGWGDGFTPSDVAGALADHGAGDLTVRINSGGGIATDGMAIHSLLKTHPGKVTVAVDGIAASAASLIAMAGASIEMRKGAMMMIHDPSAMTLGTEDTHRKSADRLGKLADNYAGVYGARAGKSAADARGIMKAETWLTAEDAVAQGFATKVSDEAALATASFDYRIYARAPRTLPVRVRSEQKPAATAALQEHPMKKDWAAAFFASAVVMNSGLALKDLNAIIDKAETIEAANTQVATMVEAKRTSDAAAEQARLQQQQQQPAAKPWVATFFASAGASELPLAKLNEIVAASATLEAAKDALIDAMAVTMNANKPGAGAGTRVDVGAGERDKFVTGATRSLIAKAAMFNEGGKPAKDGEHNEFSPLSLRELARMSLERNGIRDVAALRDPLMLVGRAMAPVIMQGAMSTSDFTNVLANIANKALLKGYEEAAETFQLWTGKGTLTDFKTTSRVDLGLFPSLTKVPEGAEYTYAKMSDRGVNFVLASYGKMFAITRQSIINDDLGVFTKIPAKMGNAAKRTIGDLVYAILTSNPNAPDGTALFHANHANLISGGSSAMSATSLDSGRVKMGTQKDPDSIKSGLNIRPAYLLVPIALKGTANQLMTSQAEPGQENPAVANRVANMSQVVDDARLDVASSTAWYLAANPNQFDTVEVDYLNGVEAPMLEQKEGWNVDGVEFKVRLDAGVTLIDFRGLFKSAGA